MPLDVLLTVPYFPRAGHKIDAQNVTIQGGGPVPNCLVGLTRLGLRTAFIGAVGNDFTGNLGYQELKSEGINCKNIIVKRSQDSAIASGMIESGTGRRTIALHRKINVSPDDLTLDKYPIPKVIHLDGRDLQACIKLARWGKSVGSQISFDIGSVRNDVSSIFPLVDHLVVADAYAFPFTGSHSVTKAIEKLSRLCPGEIVITEGIKGSTGYDGYDIYFQPAFKVRNVDTTGAGDAFHAGYLFSLIKGMAMPKRLCLGAVTSALKCSHPGARTGAPTLEQVKAFLSRKRSIYV
jgi:sulfofructose kinase